MGADRYGVVKGNDNIKDFYLIPLSAFQAFETLNIDACDNDRILCVMVLRDESVLSEHSVQTRISDNDNTNNLKTHNNPSNAGSGYEEFSNVVNNYNVQSQYYPEYYYQGGVNPSVSYQQSATYNIPPHIKAYEPFNNLAASHASFGGLGSVMGSQPPFDPRTTAPLVDPSVIGQMLNSLLGAKQ
jgi:hypothetical protein